MSKQEYPRNPSDLHALSLLTLCDFDVGDEVWVPVSPIRSNRFRAFKIEIKDRISVGNYEQHHAIEEWPQSDRLPLNHEYSDGGVR